MKDWKTITSTEDVDAIIKASATKPQIIFKDSTTCGISAHAKDRLVNGYELLSEKADFYYLDLLTYRPVSNYIAEVTGVTHMSPQILVLKDEAVTYMTSHHSINPAIIAKQL